MPQKQEEQEEQRGVSCFYATIRCVYPRQPSYPMPGSRSPLVPTTVLSQTTDLPPYIRTSHEQNEDFQKRFARSGGRWAAPARAAFQAAYLAQGGTRGPHVPPEVRSARARG